MANPRRKGHRSAKHAAAARTNGIKAAAVNAARAARPKRTVDSDQDQDFLTDFQRYQRARADAQSEIARKRKLENDEREEHLVAKAEVLRWQALLIGAILRTVDDLPTILTGIFPEPDLAQKVATGLAEVNRRIRDRLANDPELSKSSPAANAGSKVPTS